MNKKRLDKKEIEKLKKPLSDFNDPKVKMKLCAKAKKKRMKGIKSLPLYIDLIRDKGRTPFPGLGIG